MSSFFNLRFAIIAWLVGAPVAVVQAAVELPLGDGRQLVLELNETDWLIEQETGLPNARVRLRALPESLRVIAGFQATDRTFSEELVERLRREHIDYLVRKGVKTPVLRDLEVEDGVGFAFSGGTMRDRIAYAPADFGYIILHSGITLSYYAGPNDRDLERYQEIETALRSATVSGAIDEALVATTVDGEIKVTLSFEVGFEGAATRLTIVDSENPAFNGLALKQIVGRKFPQLRPGRRYTQPVIVRLIDDVDAPTDPEGQFVPPLPPPPAL